jgi:hypothetical protein
MSILLLSSRHEYHIDKNNITKPMKYDFATNLTAKMASKLKAEFKNNIFLKSSLN